MLIRGFEVVKEEFLKDCETRDSVKMPLRGTKKSAGYDFFIPCDVTIDSKESVVIWTNIKAYMCDDEVLELYPRSSIAIKKNIRIKNIVGIVDSDYYSNVDNDGNIGIFLYNFGEESVSFKKGEAVIQGIFKKYLIADNCNSENERIGGVGSTSKKEVNFLRERKWSV